MNTENSRPNPDRSETTSIVVGNDELFTIRDAMRELNRIVDKIESGEIEKAVLMRRGRMVAVVCGLDQYDGA